ncbi:MAG: energy-coupling factor transporter transmembrane component T [bacterium]
MKYEHKDTILHRISPIIKILYSIAVSVLIIILHKPIQLSLLVLAVLFIFALAKPSWQRIKPLFFVVLAIVITTVFSQSLFYYFEPKTPIITLVPKQIPVIGWLTKGVYIYKEGIIYGLIQSLRLIAATFMALTIVLTTHSADMIAALNRMRLPRSLSFVISISIRFFPHLLEETKRIILALRLRGLKTKGMANAIKTMRFALVPLVINSLRQARLVALAAEVRGFQAENFSRKGSKRQSNFNTLELITIAFFIILMYGAVLPFKMGLSKIPFLHAFFFSVPFTCVLFIGIRLIPKFGTATFLICGHCLFNQIISRGINPLWWPYALIQSLILEGYFLLTKNYLNTYFSAVTGGALRGLVAYLYFYCVAGPFIWHKFYAPWYITIQTIQGIIGSGLGGLLGYKIGKIVEKVYKYGGL